MLATELSSTIYPLSSIGVVSLSTMNDYLTSLTGIHLDYDAQVHEDPPLPRVRTPSRHGSRERTPVQKHPRNKRTSGRKESRESAIARNDSVESLSQNDSLDKHNSRYNVHSNSKSAKELCM